MRKELNSIKGLKAEVLLCVRKLDPCVMKIVHDGYVTKDLMLGESFIVRLTIAAGAKVFACSVDGPKNVRVMRTMDVELNVKLDPCDMVQRERVVGHQVSVHQNLDRMSNPCGVTYTRYPESSIRIIEVTDNGVCRLFELALVAHNGDFFLVLQHQYDVACCRYAGRVLCEQTDATWPQMSAVLAEILSTEDLPNMPAELPAKTEITGEDLPEGQGRVRWYNFAQGMGEAVMHNGTKVRLHRNHIALRGQGRLPSLQTGDVISCTVQKIRQRAGARPTQFEFEAVSIQRISPAPGSGRFGSDLPPPEASSSTETNAATESVEEPDSGR